MRGGHTAFLYSNQEIKVLYQKVFRYYDFLEQTFLNKQIFNQIISYIVLQRHDFGYPFCQILFKLMKCVACLVFGKHCLLSVFFNKFSKSRSITRIHIKNPYFLTHVVPVNTNHS